MGLGTVLLLNADYQAMRLISVERAVGLWFENIVELVEEVPGEVLRSPSISLPKPQVVRLKRYTRIPTRGRSLFSKRRVFARDAYRCMYCYKELKGRDATIDHVVPRSRGGKTTWENIVAACKKCNSKKSDRLLEELGWRLDITPGPPQDHGVIFRDQIPEEVYNRWILGKFEVGEYV